MDVDTEVNTTSLVWLLPISLLPSNLCCECQILPDHDVSEKIQLFLSYCKSVSFLFLFLAFNKCVFWIDCATWHIYRIMFMCTHTNICRYICKFLYTDLTSIHYILYSTHKYFSICFQPSTNHSDQSLSHSYLSFFFSLPWRPYGQHFLDLAALFSLAYVILESSLDTQLASINSHRKDKNEQIFAIFSISCSDIDSMMPFSISMNKYIYIYLNGHM